jgi:hypothetical protein
MSSTSTNPGLIGRAKEFLRLVRSVVDHGHDFEALAKASTILDRSEQTLKGEALCNIDDFVSVQRILKDIEGLDGAELDGGGPEADADARRRFGTTGLPFRRKAFDGAAHVLEHGRLWRSPLREITGGSSMWRSSGWFPAAMSDSGSVLFQPLIVLVSASEGTLSRGEAILRELCSPPSIKLEDGPALSSLRAPYGAAVLLDPLAHGLPKSTRLLREIVKLRGELLTLGWNLPAVTFVVLASDPVNTCFAEWCRGHRDDAKNDFVTAWREALKGDGDLAAICQEATSFEKSWKLVQELTGAKVDFPRIAEAEDFQIQALCSGARVLASQIENLHKVAELLWREAGAMNPQEETHLRARRIPAGNVPEEAPVLPNFALEEVESIYARETLASFYPPEARSAFSAKWATPTPAEPSRFLYMFPHIPKTAGTSVHAHLINHLRSEETFINVPVDGVPGRRENPVPFTLRPLSERRRALVLFGHGLLQRHADYVPGRQLREITTLRDPADRVLSFYNFTMGLNEREGREVVSFEEWYRGQPKNFQIHWLARHYLQLDTRAIPDAEIHERVAEALEKFWLVCTVETFEADINLLLAELGVPPLAVRVNVAGVNYPKRLEGDAALRQRLIAENQLEYELYQRWLERARQRHAGA